MKALSIRQPWALLIVKGYKDVENRSWSTKFRGRVYIHAGKKFDEEGYQWILNNQRLPVNVSQLMVSGAQVLHSRTFKRRSCGAIIGEVDIVDCVTESDSPWFVGPYGIVLANAVQFGAPIPCRGQLGFFNVELPGAKTEFSQVFRSE